MKKRQVLKKSLLIFLSLLLSMPLLGNVGLSLAWADEAEKSTEITVDKALDIELEMSEEPNIEAPAVEEASALQIDESSSMPVEPMLKLFGLSDEELFALGGKEELTDKMATWLLEQGSSISAATLLVFEEKDDVWAVFEGNDTALSKVSVVYDGSDYEFAFISESLEILIPDDEGVDEEVVVPTDETLEVTALSDSTPVAIVPLEDIVPLADPPTGEIGKFVLASWFTSDPSYDWDFPGSITLFDSSLTVISFGDNSPGYNNGRVYCARIGAANWGDPSNGNYRVGTVYAELVSVDTARGIAWYKITIVPDWPAIPAAPGSSIGVQVLEAMLALKWSFDGLIELYKSSASPDITDGNACYSLEGAQYGIYRSYSDAQNDNNRVQVLTTNASGYAKSSTLTQGTYYVREIVASSGYYIDGSIYTVNLSSAVYTIRVKEVPAGDPLLTIVRKLDAKTGGAYGLDDPAGKSLAGARFTIRYYDGYYDTVEDAEASGTPTRTWTIETGEGGVATLRTERLVAGSDSLYLNVVGDPIIPLGTVLTKEVKAPDGYILPDPNIEDIQQIKENPDMMTVIRFNTLEVPNEPRELQLMKTDAETDEVKGGAVFEIHKESAPGAGDWEKLYTKTTDDDGSFLVSPIAAGSYKLIETKAPVGYQLPSTSGLPVEIFVTVEEDVALTVIEAKDYKGVPLIIEKRDVDTSELIPDTEFVIYRYPVEIDDGVVVGDVSLITADMPGWVYMGKAVTDDDGKATFEGLPYGYYKIVETKPHPDYASYEESGGTDRFVILDKNTIDEVQVFEDMAVSTSCVVYKTTIAITSSALDGTDLMAAKNVGVEEFLYHFGGASTANVWADEFVITDSLAGPNEKGYLMTKLWTGTATPGLDFDGCYTLLYSTNFSSDNVPVFTYDLMRANPDNPNNPDRVMVYSTDPGWRIWAEGLSTTAQIQLDVADLGLAPGEYITGLKAVYGGVEVGFGVGSRYGGLDFSYSVVATRALVPYDAMGVETVIYGDVTSQIARNIVLRDDDYDAVETRVIAPVMYPPTTIGIDRPYIPVLYRSLPQTGDSNALMMMLFMATLLVAGGICIIAALRQRRKKEYSAAGTARQIPEGFGIEKYRLHELFDARWWGRASKK